MGHHAQQAFLGMNAIDQRLVLLTQHQELILELEFLLGPTPIKFRGSEAEAETAYHPILFPARYPPFELLKDVASCKNLFRVWSKFDEGWRHHKAMQFQKFGLVRGISDLQGDFEAQVFPFQKLHHGTKILARQVVSRCHQQ